uniref:GH08684p n=1 Tax=Drosophila melanogaster TaxID=7227 RepID=Q95SQ0_DROME|nr:GH08684p [Drosophila melanogaster]
MPNPKTNTATLKKKKNLIQFQKPAVAKQQQPKCLFAKAADISHKLHTHTTHTLVSV